MFRHCADSLGEANVTGRAEAALAASAADRARAHLQRALRLYGRAHSDVGIARATILMGATLTALGTLLRRASVSLRGWRVRWL